jgi:SAM-dependent methyltransferase
VSELAEAYDRHVGRYGAQLAAELIHVAGLRRGQRALDVGCGPGALTRALADTLGGEHVAAVDPSEAFVAACRERVPGASVRVGVGERLPFEDSSFDAVLAQLVVQLMDAARGVPRCAATRPGAERSRDLTVRRRRAARPRPRARSAPPGGGQGCSAGSRRRQRRPR